MNHACLGEDRWHATFSLYLVRKIIRRWCLPMPKFTSARSLPYFQTTHVSLKLHKANNNTQSKGFNYGFIEYDDPGAAERAMASLNGRSVHQQVRGYVVVQTLLTLTVNCRRFESIGLISQTLPTKRILLITFISSWAISVMK